MSDLELVAEFLKSQSTLTLATISEEGLPGAAPLFYLLQDDLRMYWLSSGSSGHSDNLAQRNAVAVAVYGATENWRDIRGVQMRGTAELVVDQRERKAVVKAYVERFHLGKLFQLAISQSKLYRFTPSWIRYIDNSKHFGYKFEISLPR